jgi:hypothetical protein
MYGHHSSDAEDRSGNVMAKISSGIPHRRKGAELRHFWPGAPNGNADPGPPISGQVSRMELYYPNSQGDARLKKRSQKRRHLLIQNPDPNRQRLSQKGEPARRASHKSRDSTISLGVQFDRAVGNEPRGRVLYEKLRFVNQHLHEKPLSTKLVN